MKCFYVYNHNLCSKQSQLGTHLLCFFKITFLLDFTPNFSIWPIFKMRFVKYFANKIFQIFYTLNLEVSEHIMNRFWTQKKFFSDFLLVQNVFWNFKIQCVKNLKLFIFKIFHKPHFTKWPYAKIRCKIYFFSFLKNHSRWVAGGDCFEHKKWFYT